MPSNTNVITEDAKRTVRSALVWSAGLGIVFGSLGSAFASPQHSVFGDMLWPLINTMVGGAVLAWVYNRSRFTVWTTVVMLALFWGTIWAGAAINGWRLWPYLVPAVILGTMVMPLRWALALGVLGTAVTVGLTSYGSPGYDTSVALRALRPALLALFFSAWLMRLQRKRLAWFAEPVPAMADLHMLDWHTRGRALLASLVKGPVHAVMASMALFGVSQMLIAAYTQLLTTDNITHDAGANLTRLMIGVVTLSAASLVWVRSSHRTLSFGWRVALSGVSIVAIALAVSSGMMFAFTATPMVAFLVMWLLPDRKTFVVLLFACVALTMQVAQAADFVPIVWARTLAGGAIAANLGYLLARHLRLQERLMTATLERLHLSKEKSAPSSAEMLQDSKGLNRAVWLAFALSLAVCTVAIALLLQREEAARRANLQTMAHYKAAAVEKVVREAGLAAVSLGEALHSPESARQDFEIMSRKLLPHFDVVTALQLMPNGVVCCSYPLQGNEAAIGLDLFADPARRREAILARDSHTVFLAGPFPLKQGGWGVVTRYPLYKKDDDIRSFWGFASALVRLPSGLVSAGLDELKRAGTDYQLWHIHPESGQPMVFAYSTDSDTPFSSGDAVTEIVKVPNGEWYLSVKPQRGWVNMGRWLFWSQIGLVLSVIIAVLVRVSLQLRNARTVNRDSQRFHQIIQGAPVAMLMVNSDLHISLANQKAAHLTDYTYGDLLGLPLDHLIPAGARAGHQALARNFMEQPDNRKMMAGRALTILTRSGLEIPVEISLSTIDTVDGRMTLVAIADLTAHRKAEQHQLELLHAAEEASRAKSEFVANMSHEIRTPMNAILGMVTLLGNTALQANQADYMSKTELAARSLLGLINNVLDFSKIDAEKLELEAQTFALDRLLQNLAVVLSAAVGEKPIDVLYDIDPDIPPVLIGDAMRLNQVLVNLCSNAIKFTSHGQVIIRLRCTSMRDGVATVAFEVQDSGIGIARENQPKIFESFSQAESNTTRRFGGTGLGLTISKRLIELMGGQIALASELGVGSTFSFALDLKVGHTSQIEATGHVAPIPTGAQRQPSSTTEVLSVLVVDDNPIAAELLDKLLRPSGWAVAVAHSGPQALELVRAAAHNGSQPFDLAFVDLQMPQMDGWETIEALQALQRQLRGVAPRCILLSSNGRDNLAHRSQDEQSRLCAFLVKPVTASELMAAARPLTDAQASVRRAPRDVQRQLDGLRVLVVDDNSVNQQVAQELLRSQGATVTVVGDGRQAVDLMAVSRGQYDAVLMDVQMPVMDGYEATRAVRGELGMADLPIIGLTANVSVADAQACRDAGMDAHVGKPFDLAKLVSLLIKLTGHQPPAQLQKLSPPADGPVVMGLSDDPLQWETADIDLPGALARMGGMHRLYMSAAQELDTSLATMADEMQRLQQQADTAKALALMHTFKGTTATLGLRRLSAALAHAEAACKSFGDLTPLGQHLAELRGVTADAVVALRQAMERIASRYPASMVEGNVALDAQTLPLEGLAQLCGLLESGDLEALHVFAELRGSFGVARQEAAQRLDEALQKLDLEAAAQICKELMADAPTA